MAKKSDTAYGLLFLIAIILAVVSQVIEAIINNIVPILIFIASIIILVILVKVLIKYFKRIKSKKKTLENTLTNINQKYQKSIRKIDNQKNRLILELNNIDQNFEENNKVESYNPEVLDPIDSLTYLKNILKDTNSEIQDVWSTFYKSQGYPHSNPLEELKKSLKNLNDLETPTYFKTKEEDWSLKQKNSLIKKIEESKIEFNQRLKENYKLAQKEIIEETKLLVKKYTVKEKKFLLKKSDFEKTRKEYNNQIDCKRKEYFEDKKSAIIFYYNELISSFEYHPNFVKSVKVDFNENNKTLVIEYLLPEFAKIPSVKEYRYLKTKDIIKEIYFSQRELNFNYEEIIYGIVLDIIDQSFQCDLINQIESIALNGYSNNIDKATGLHKRTCILTVFSNKEEFQKINLAEVDPKTCFKNLKGISAHNLKNLSSIKPIINIVENDKRFVTSQNIEVNQATNLASMHWEDFEHLIREIFDKEFQSNGGKVKVTQSSRDGGVDAIAFDPDPIRGGKIVIQAKRYTNIVGVSAVRDLYGTVLNEGATKGILVTTSDYGSDSFNFAKDKPLSLINGGNLLYLLEKHGYSARINIKEAKLKLKQQSTNPNNGSPQIRGR